MTLSKILELLGIPIILAFGAVIFNMNGTLSTVSTKTDFTAERLDKIVEALPGIQARVATDALKRPIAGFIATSNPVKTGDNAWTTDISLYNAKSGELKIYTFATDETMKDTIRYALSGKVKTVNPSAYSFAEMAEFADDQGATTQLPDVLDNQASFLIKEKNLKSYDAYLKGMSRKAPQIKDLGPMANWQDVEHNLKNLYVPEG
ncbi:hypothetical protein N7414_11605 [Pseudomonas sp. GD04087]|uniref:hypothetical protein n=1 Tax=unclassified Pseudomonas TaxID=196821 RepID=UPI00244BA57D|nr:MULTISPECIES: hypothetical protein [unclassified Pseudomonas]MDH0289762.1 hypothetical protein [Pseudomonas sp. GD04087]MDH1049764.1 hypothetical protein [Pseudomonas sp. GD03903]MDH2002836.1 hypothetical protein [Pseudomonas sp. GD03691]